MSTEIEINSPKRLRHLKLVSVIIALIAAGVVTNGIISRSHAEHELTTWTDAQAVPTVATVTPQSPAAEQSLELPGQLAAFVNAPIYARVSGYLQTWYADIGTHVKAGQLLGLIDTPDLDQQLLQARADLANTVANENLAATTARRWTQMLKQDSVSQQDADEKTSDLIAKQATVVASRANVRALKRLNRSSASPRRSTVSSPRAKPISAR
jgi:multidrug efflux system membrane fusion protein